MAKDYYSILGIDRGAGADEIKRAYRRLSKELHPDKHKGDKETEQHYKDVNEAYEVLNNPKKKQMYDQFGTTDAHGFGGGSGGFDFSNFTSGDFGGFGDIFESFFGGRQSGARQQTKKRGADKEVSLIIEFTEAVSGVKKTFKLEKNVSCGACEGSGLEKGSKMVSCKTCNGTGQVVKTAQSFFGVIQQTGVCPDCSGAGSVPEKPCRKCGGSGRIRDYVNVTVDVPAGIHDGQTLRLQEEGEAGIQGAAAGDLFVHIHVKPDTRFKRDGDDIYTTLTISVLEAILGSQETITTVQGKVKLTIPEGTQSGQVLRLKGKGMPVLSSSRFGDHYVKIKVEIPKKLSRKERELLEEWKRLSE